MAITLRPYQEHLPELCREAYRHGRKALQIVMPTGAGKGVLLSEYARLTALKGNRVLILVHRDFLIRQLSDNLTEWGCSHGIIAAGWEEMDEHPVQIASVQSLVRRLHRWPNNFNLLIFDESQHCRAATWEKIIAAYPRARIMGLTATPIRSDGRGLGKVFDHLIVGISMRELIGQGYLADYRMFAPQVRPDLNGLHKRMGDYIPEEAATAMDRPTITGDALLQYRKHMDGKPVIAFCCTLAHAHHVLESFVTAGIPSALIEGTSTHEERKAMINSLGNGSLKVMVSVNVVSEGLDIPTCQGVLLLRPTQSLGLALQQIGRCMRPKPDGSHAIILDHAGNSLIHGMPCEERIWDLQDGMVQNAKQPNAIRTCRGCFAIYRASLGSVCPYCGHDSKEEKKLPKHAHGELTEQSPEYIAKMRELQQKARDTGEFEKLERIRVMRGYKFGWSNHVLRARIHKRAMKELE